MALEEYELAFEVLNHIVESLPEEADAYYYLGIAIKDGFLDICWIKMDPDLSSLKNDERFLRLLDRYFN